MKFNMKNRPSFRGKSLTEMTVTEKDNAIIECVQWFEGFESELRKKVVSPTNTKSVAVYDVIKEILGDE
ncbi:hypothetical protein MUP01_10875 [Candidatus Bathyarchaeota archaeon]|nr:hypothetical protein [Candidatus Bathyarchaeota archaeon]